MESAKGLQLDPSMIRGLENHYQNNPIGFINDWCITYDPRNANKDIPTTLPFVTFPRQDQLVNFFSECLQDQECGLVEKSRDGGATWLACAFSVWLWRFVPGSSVGWGSRKEALVDRLGDADSIFEKLRITIDNLPRFLWPAGFDIKKHCSYMRIINPYTGSTITGEAGDNIGRGGRKSIYFKDESAHYERPEKIEAALADNTNVQIDISSVCGTASVFARRRVGGQIWEPGKEIERGVVRVFILDWRDDPRKDQAWYDRRRAKAEREGLLHLFAQEVDRDYAASVENVLIPQAWVKAAIDAHAKLKFTDDGEKMAALDVADEGGDKNAYTERKGVVLKMAKHWAEGDVGETTQKAIGLMRLSGTKTNQYDCIGVGSGVKAEFNRIIRENPELKKKFDFIKWNAGAGPLYPNQRFIKGDKDSPLMKDMFPARGGLNSQAGWMLRLRFEKTFNAVTKDVKYDSSELISIPAQMENRHQLETELSQPTYSRTGSGQIVIDKKPKGTKSPNLFDSIKQNYWPVRKKKVLI